MPSRVPLTNLTDAKKGGAPMYVGGDRLATEEALIGPYFDGDTDMYFKDHVNRRGLCTIAHFPPAGASTVDFVTLFLRNSSTTERAYVNVMLASDLAVQLRVSGILASSPVYADVLLVEADGEAELVARVDAASNELSVSVISSGRFDPSTPPRIEFDPPPAGNMSAFVTLTASGAIGSVTVIEPFSHSYAAPPSVRAKGGTILPIGFYEGMDEDTIVHGAAQAGRLTVIGTRCQTEHANTIASPGDALIVNNELRVIRSINSQQREFFLDAPLSNQATDFDTWSYLPFLSASATSTYRTGPGTLRTQPSLGPAGVVCSEPHGLSVGDYIVYSADTSAPQQQTPASGSTTGLAAAGASFTSDRVAAIASATEFTVERAVALGPLSRAAWLYVYALSQTVPGSNQSLDTVRVISYVKIPHAEGRVVDLKGLAGRHLYIRNHNFMNLPGSYYNQALAPHAPVVEFGLVGDAHATQHEVANTIDPATVLEIELKPQPAPEVQVLAGFPLNGGLATDVGRRPVVALYARGTVAVSRTVVFWGYYVRYTPESGTNYTQAINI